MTVPPDMMQRVAGVTVIETPVHEPTFEFPDRVRAALASDHKLWALHQGKGKRGGDTTDAGYDHAIMLGLVKHGVRDPVALVTACRWRGCYTLKSSEELARVVRRLSLQADTLVAEAERDERERPKVASLVVYQSTPPIYEVHGPLGSFTCSMAELMNPAVFARRYAEAFRVIPSMPKDTRDWLDTVNALLASARVLEQPEDASEEGHALSVLRGVLEALPRTDVPSHDSLKRGCMVLLDDGRAVLSASALMRRMLVDLPKMRVNELARLLRLLGFESTNNCRLEDRQVRVWVAPKEAL